MIREIVDYVIINNFSSYKVTDNAFNKVYGIYLSGQVIGYIDYSIMYERAELNYIFIKEEYRKKGFARQLINYMMDDLKKNDIFSITLEVNVDNSDAIKLYTDFGFEKISIRPNYYGNTDAMLMEKKMVIR